MERLRSAIVALTVGACANARPGVPDGPSGDGAPDSAPASECAAGQFATNVDTNQLLVTCAPIEGPTQRALDADCSVYFGWRDSCDGCTTDPAKWGFVSGGSCTNGVGADNTCTMA